ncbi:uncharacterized protein LOC130712019 [Lotus japonicus]|uniref:uncharacterized protein LOC130712019 n=1 Tax=Lotus japonicus TaxID=34305 RepID=UPI0025869E68|nr:uncharacterized protein LOC130712019 [Lotus japonicus]
MKSVSGIYRQKKKNPAPTKSSKKQPPSRAATTAVPQTPALPDLQDESNGNEAVLRQFDLNMAYGPCIGMPRLARWERAQKLGLNPPQEIERLLKSGKVQAESLWNGCI